jgi:hypothetical protein
MVVTGLIQEDTSTRTGILVDTATRLRLATRIHFALLRHYGQKVEISDLMKGEGEVREAIWVCEASGDRELAAMARQLRMANEAPFAGNVPQDTAAWSADTSGFGVSRPLDLDVKPAPAAPSRWLHPSTWMRRGGAPRQG